MPLARISLTLSRHFSLSFIASGRSSGLHPVSSHSCWMYVRADRPAFAWPYVGVHRSTSLMSSFLRLQQCPACLVCLTWIVLRRWKYVRQCWSSKDKFYQQRSPMDSHTWTHFYYPTSKKFNFSTQCGHWMTSKGLDWQGRIALEWESQGNPYSEHT